MIVEVVLFKAKDGEAESLREGLRTAQAVIARAAGYRRSTFHRGVEESDVFLLRIEWETLAAHMGGFRGSALHAEWRSHFFQFVDGDPRMTHYEVFAER
jgi:heme-degrading monooxygenase HmoA